MLTNKALPEIVCLAFRRAVARELPIDLVLNIRHRDEGSHDTIPGASLHCKRD